MKTLSGIFASWSHYVSQCCRPFSPAVGEKHLDDNAHNPFAVIYDEPSLMPPLSVSPSRRTPIPSKQEQAPRKRRGSGWSSFSARKRLLPSSTSLPRRPQISAPSNFRHVYSESIDFPEQDDLQANLQQPFFPPLELNIHMTNNQLSPILPHFDSASPPVTPPPRAFTISSSSDDSLRTSHQRSRSSTSFHIPRRPLNGGSVFDSPISGDSTPQRPQPVRIRGNTSSSVATSPIMEDLVERVAHAMLERDRLQEQIEDVMERQSIYVSSRPSTAHGQQEMCPMPALPALPPDAPSFSERLSSDRPQTAPTKPAVQGPYQANSSRKLEGRAPPPPLPLRLRPPLRKKKSFSQVSTWLFPADSEKHSTAIGLTNTPKPLTHADGFYQVATRRSSIDSDSTSSDWTVEEQTLPTPLSPRSVTTPRGMISPAFGTREDVQIPQRTSVGVAF
ncbi:hypothetical protein F5Y18DRAFT_220661 [Xylariaceae sp. FL1019]|nr:hypothetical protein F5Y18DRAFT_220661 [Xylariaceae sp. FL1019]